MLFLKFGDFELDEGRFELRHLGRPLTVQKRVLETILFLARNRDRVITKEELIGGPWQGAAVTEAAIAKVIKEARRLLGYDAIATVRGIGFRFLAAEVPQDGSALVRSNISSASVPASRLFVGRDSELARLYNRWARAEVGEGGLLLVSGPPGIGKTKVVERFATELRQQRVQALWGRCWDAQGMPAFWPWPEVIRAYADSQGLESLRAVARGHVLGLAALVPDLLGEDARLPRHFEESPILGLTVLGDVSSFLRGASNETPLLIILEDVHLASDDSLKLLDVLTRSLHASNLLILATCRSLEARDRPLLRNAVEGSVPHAEVIALAELTSDEVGLWCSAATGHVPLPAVAEAIHAATGGYPLLIENLVRALPVDWNGADLVPLRNWDSSLADNITCSIRLRLSTLRPATLAVLRIACVLGQEFSVTLLAELTRRELVDLSADLELAIQHGTLRRASVTRLCFSHALLRETLYRELDSAERMELHAMCAKLLSSRATETAEAIVQAAHHAFLALPGATGVDVVDLALRAADWARGQLAYALAADYQERALEALELARPEPRRRGGILISLAQSQWLAGRRDAAIQSCREALALARHHDLNRLFGEAVFGAATVLREDMVFDEGFRSLLPEALSRTQDHPDIQVRLLATHALATRMTTDANACQVSLEQAAELARRAGNPATLLEVLRSCYLSGVHQGEAGLRLASEMLATASALGRTELALEASEWRAHWLLELGRGQEFAAAAAACTHMGQQLVIERFAWHGLVLKSTRALLGGRLSDAERLCRDAFRVGELALGAIATGRRGAQLLMIAKELDGPERVQLLREVEDHGREVLALVPSYGPWVIAMGRLAVEFGRLEQAQMILAKLVSPQMDQIPNDGNRILCLALLADLVCSLERADLAASLLEAFTPFAGAHAVGAMGGCYFGPVTYHLGQLALLRDDFERAGVWLASAVADAERIESPLWKAYAELAIAEALTQRGRPDDQDTIEDHLHNVRRVAGEYRLPRLASAVKSAIGQNPRPIESGES